MIAFLVVLLTTSFISPVAWHYCIPSVGYLTIYAFESFLTIHHLVANKVKNVDERGGNIMSVRTLPSLLVLLVELVEMIC